LVHDQGQDAAAAACSFLFGKEKEIARKGKREKKIEN